MQNVLIDWINNPHSVDNYELDKFISKYPFVQNLHLLKAQSNQNQSNDRMIAQIYSVVYPWLFFRLNYFQNEDNTEAQEHIEASQITDIEEPGTEFTDGSIFLHEFDQVDLAENYQDDQDSVPIEIIYTAETKDLTPESKSISLNLESFEKEKIVRKEEVEPERKALGLESSSVSFPRLIYTHDEPDKPKKTKPKKEVPKEILKVIQQDVHKAKKKESVSPALSPELFPAPVMESNDSFSSWLLSLKPSKGPMPISDSKKESSKNEDQEKDRIQVAPTNEQENPGSDEIKNIENLQSSDLERVKKIVEVINRGIDKPIKKKTQKKKKDQTNKKKKKTRKTKKSETKPKKKRKKKKKTSRRKEKRQNQKHTRRRKAKKEKEKVKKKAKNSKNRNRKEVQKAKKTKRSKIKRNTKVDQRFVSEALSELLWRQGYRKKALKMLEILSLKNPGKKTYFAARIKKLKKK